MRNRVITTRAAASATALRMLWGVWQKLNRHQWGLWELRTAWIDLRLGGYIGGRARTRLAHLGATDVHNMPYRVISDATLALHIQSDDVLVDVGCGLGRVLNWWLSRGWQNRIIGIELDPEVAAEVRRRLSRFSQVNILTGDAVDLTPADATICFLFNPFNRAVLKRWHDGILGRHTANRLTVIYVNCQHLDVFRGAACWSIKILSKHPADYCEIAVIELRRQAAFR